MVNEFVYCPRLAYLMWVQGEWADSADTADGRRVHRRVDSASVIEFVSADEIDDTERQHVRSVTLASQTLGIIAKLDLIDVVDGAVIPVDYKRGKRPHVAAGAYDPERIQVCLQGILLAEHGYACTEGALYFRESRERVRMPFDADLRSMALAAGHGLRLAVAAGMVPPPTEDFRKCPRCSLVGICLPDEVRALTSNGTAPRPLAVRPVEAMPTYVQIGYGKIGKSGDTLEISAEDVPTTKVRLIDVSQLVLFGNVGLTTPCLHELFQRDIPVSWHSYGGWFLGHTIGTGHKNVELRTAQYRASFDGAFCLRFAKGLVAAKIQNARTILRRNLPPDAPQPDALDIMRRARKETEVVPSIQSLLGVEGGAAAAYFGQLPMLIRPPETGETSGGMSFDFARRNRRPPTDPVNAMLSFAYALLVRTFTVALTAVGLDVYRGFYHQPRYGRPALALDMMEPYRPIIADSAVLMAVNNGEIRTKDFVRVAGAVSMTPIARKALIAAFERRLSQSMTHPVFGYEVTWRQALDIQARLLGRHLTGEIAVFPHILPR